MINIEDIFKHFGTKKALADKLGCVPQAITRWAQEGVPANAAIEIERITKGKFKAVNIPLYVNKNKNKAA